MWEYNFRFEGNASVISKLPQSIVSFLKGCEFAAFEKIRMDINNKSLFIFYGNYNSRQLAFQLFEYVSSSLDCYLLDQKE